MAARGGVAHADVAGELAQRQVGRAALVDDPRRPREQRGAQVAVVVGAARSRWPPASSLPSVVIDSIVVSDYIPRMTSSATKWTAADLPDMAGRTVVVTGANSGIGRAAARAFAGEGAPRHRSPSATPQGRGAPPRRSPARPTCAGSTSPTSRRVRAFAADWDGDIDVLVNNAGVMATPERRTADGFELQIGTNHLGHFALTNLLLPQIRAAS